MYTPVWKRPDSPTAAMNNTEMLKYYKSRDVADSCAFALRAGGRHLPEHVSHAYEALAEAVFYAGKETPAHRRELARVRSLLADVGGPAGPDRQALGRVRRGESGGRVMSDKQKQAPRADVHITRARAPRVRRAMQMATFRQCRRGHFYLHRGPGSVCPDCYR